MAREQTIPVEAVGNEWTQDRLIADRLISALIEGFVLISVVLTPWMCPGQCIRPGFLSGESLFEIRGVGFRLVFSAIVIALLILWMLRLLVRWRLDWKRCPVTLCLAALFILGVWQLCPLPHRVLAAVSPATTRVYDRLIPASPEAAAEADAASVPRTESGLTISLERESTRDELFRLLGVVLVFAIVRNSIASPASFRRLCIAVTVNGVFLPLFGVMRHYSGGSPTMLYRLFLARNQVFGPFLYRNLFALYVNLCIGLGFALLLIAINQIKCRSLGEMSHKSMTPKSTTSENPIFQVGFGEILLNARVLWCSCAIAAMICGVVLSQSRGGLVVLLGALAVCAIIRIRSDGLRQRAGAEALVLVAAFSFLLVCWMGFNLAKSRYASLNKGETFTTDDRLHLWSSVWPLAREFPVWGTGFGSFYNVEPLSQAGYVRPERRDSVVLNDYLQGFIEGGAGRLLLHLTLLFLVFHLGYRASRHPNPLVRGLALGGLFSLCCFAFHCFVEPGLSHAPIVFLATVIGAHLCALGDPVEEAVSRKQFQETRPVSQESFGGMAPAVAAILAAGLVVLMLSYGLRSEKYERAALRYIGFDSASADVHRQLQPSLQAAAAYFPESADFQIELGRNHCIVFEDETKNLNNGLTRIAVADWFQCLATVGLRANLALVDEVVSCAARGRMRAQWAEPEQDRLLQQHIVPALQHFIRARALSPLLVKAHFGIAYSREKLGGNFSLATYLDRVKYLRPADPRIWYQCGVLELANHDNEEAWKSWKRSLELGSCHFQDIVASTQKSLSPHEILDKVLPDDPNVLVAASALIYPQASAIAERRPFLEKALNVLESRSAAVDAREWHLKASICAALGNDDDAQTAFRFALSMDPRNVARRFEYANFLVEQAQYEEARKELLVVLRQKIDHAAAQKLVLEIATILNSTAATDALFTETKKNFGTVVRGTLLRHDFQLKNTTGADLHIANIRTSCGCATGTAERSLLEPNESTNIAITIDTAKYAGPRTFTFYVEFDKPFNKEGRLSVRAQSREDFTLSPPQLTLGRANHEPSYVTIEYLGSQDLRITGIEKEADLLQTQLLELSRKPGRILYQLRVQLSENTSIAAWNADVWLKTNDAITPRLRVPIAIQIEPRLTVTPALLNLGPIPPGSQITRKVIVRGEQPFKITRIEGSDSQFLIVTDGAESKKVHVMNITVNAGQQTTEILRQFKLITDLPKDGTAAFTIEGRVAR